MLERAQGSVGFDHTRVDAELAPPQQPMRVQCPQEDQVHRIELPGREPAADDTQARMIGRRVAQVISQEAADGQRVGAPRGNRPLARKVL